MDSNRFWHRLEEVGIGVGILLVALSVLALATPLLSGPIFHPAVILFGVLLVYVCGMMLGGADRDQATHD